MARSYVELGPAAAADPGFRRGMISTRRRVVGALMLGVIGGYFAVCLPRPSYEPAKADAFYAQLTDSFLAGRTSLPVKPDPRLLALPNPYRPSAPYRLHDASLYKGKYYLYFGPTPVLICLLPYKLVTGFYLPSRVVVPLFCSFGFLCSCGAFYLLIGRAAWSCPLWLEVAVILSLGNTQLVCFLLVRAMFYEVAVSSGYFLVMAGFLFTAWSLGLKNRLSFVLLAGLSFGLAVGCRPHLALVAVLMTAFIAVKFWRSAATLIRFVAPILVAGALLATYNYIRFDNPLEFGLRYQVTSNPAGPVIHLKASNLLPGMEYLLLLPPVVDTSFPYLHPFFTSPFLGYPSRHPGRYSTPVPGVAIPGQLIDVYPEALVGLLAAAPLSLFGLFSFWPLCAAPRNGGDAGFTLWLIRCMLVCSLAILCAVSLTGWAVGRYEVDFAPLMILASCCVVVGLWQNHGGMSAIRTRLLRASILACVAWSILLNVAIETPRLDQMSQFLSRR
jgi:hypothetical protein